MILSYLFPASAGGIPICRSPHAGRQLFRPADGGRPTVSLSCPARKRDNLPPQHSMTDFLAALGLVFVIEGLIFAAFPQAARRAVVRMTQTPDEALRLVGLLSVVLGLMELWLVRG